MNLATIIGFALFLAGVGVSLAQLWFQTWSPEMFVKIILTDAAFFAVAFIWAFLVKEHKESEKITGKNSLD
jgi:hypothetical protein